MNLNEFLSKAHTALGQIVQSPEMLRVIASVVNRTEEVYFGTIPATLLMEVPTPNLSCHIGPEGIPTIELRVETPDHVEILLALSVSGNDVTVYPPSPASLANTFSRLTARLASPVPPTSPTHQQP